jgi:diguanylate cyclase (GGDEF)-like protein/PAS domain S-box-containing protein
MSDRRERLARLAVGVIAFAIALLLHLSGSLTRIEWDTTDLYSRWMRHEVPSDIVIVGIDEQSLAALHHWPWPRSTHARMLHQVALSHPRHVFLDIDFSSRSSAEEDRELADAVARIDTGTLVLPAFVQNASSDSDDLMFTKPLPELQANATLGSVNLLPAADSVVREITTVWTVNRARLPGVFHLLSGQKMQPGQMTIDYSLSPRSFEFVSYIDLLEGRVGQSTLRDKTVLVGATAVELGDMQPVPVYRSLPGVIVQALAIQTARSGAPTRVGPAQTTAVLLLWTVLVVTSLRKEGWRRNVVLGAGFMALAISLTLLARYVHLQIEVVPLLLIVCVAFLGTTLRSLDAETLRAFKLLLLADGREALLRSVVDSSTESILCVDASGIIASANTPASALLACAPQTLPGRNLAQFIPDLLQIETGDALGSFRNRICETNAVTADGLSIPVELSITRVLTKNQSLYTVLLRDLRERKRQEQRLLYQANHDALTGLPNRHSLSQTLLQSMRNAGDNPPFALFLLDLTRFKEVNDTLGHSFGDIVLREVARRFQFVLGERGKLARMGGDEFVIVCAHGMDRDALQRKAQALVDCLKTPVRSDGLAIEVGVNIGIACFPEDATDPDGLLKNADIAMYSAKRRSTGCVFYSAADNAHSVRSLELLGDLRTALQRNELELHYQPKINLVTGLVESVEALLRWHHAKHGAVSPLEVIPLAESSDLLRPLTDWTLSTALTQARQWLEAGLPTRIAINLSAHMLEDLSFPARVSRALATHEVLPDLLEIEITETAMMLDVKRALTIVKSISDLGVHVSVDDYGTGFSSLRYLRDLSIDCLKLDRSFVNDLEANPDSRVIVESTLALAKALRLEVVAEGVSTAWQVDYLRRLGCDHAQGFHYSKALRSDDCAEWMRRHNGAARSASSVSEIGSRMTA